MHVPYFKFEGKPQMLGRRLRWPSACFLRRGAFHTQRDANYFRVSRPSRAHTRACTSKEEASRSSSDVTGRLLVPMFLAGATIGPLLDGIHGTVHLLEYRVAPVEFAGLHSSITVPLLLGAFYSIIGSLHTALDSLALDERNTGDDSALAAVASVLRTPGNAAATKTVQSRLCAPFVALNTGAIALLLLLSAVLYDKSWSYSQINAVLAAFAVGNYLVFDNTRQGLFLAVLCAVAAPVSELFLIRQLGLWHYPRPDIFGELGVPSWVAWCYFFYTTGVGNLARLMWKGLRQ